MKKIFKRVLAYFIDMMVILLITQSLSGIPQINKQLDNYNKYYTDYMDLYQEYVSFKTSLSSDFKDEKLTEKEYNSLLENHEKYTDILNKYYKNKKLTTDNYKKLNKKIDKDYQENYKKIYYKIEKNSIIYFIIYLIVVIAYFVGFNKYTKGQTLGKKLMRLKIINSKDKDINVPLWSYLVRALILYQPIYYIARLISINFMDVNSYYTLTSTIYEIQSYLEMLIIAMIMIRIDGRGPHDLLAQTKVVLYDKDGNEVEDKLNTIVSKRIDEVKTKRKKIIDEEPTK